MTTMQCSNTKIQKTSFVLYSKYIEQVRLLNDMQAGVLFRTILTYADSGIVEESADPTVNMMFAFIRQQMDFDHEKYEATCKKRSEAASRAGKISAEKRALKKQQEILATSVNDCQRIQHDNEYEYENEYDNENDIIYLEQQQQEEGDGVDQSQPDAHTIFLYGKNQLPTTGAELDKFRALAEHLFDYYHNGHVNQWDLEQVLERAYRPAYTDDGEGYAAFDRERADLLEFAFSQASNQNQVKWSYINAILDKYRKNNIETVAEAEEYEYQRNRGEVL